MFEPPPDDRELFDRVARWEDDSAGDVAIEDLSRSHGIDFATACLYRRWKSTSLGLPEAVDDVAASDVLLAIVPGAFYRQHADTGADGGRIIDVAAKMGLSAERIPVDSFGDPWENGRQIADWVAKRRDQRVVLVSLSKGSTDVQAGMADPNSDWRSVVGWIDFSGLLEGTAIVDWLLARPFRCLGARAMFWWHGLPFDVLPKLRRNVDGSFAAPKSIRVAHVIGVPLEKHLSTPLARRAYRRLAPLGPNDGGGILLGDAARRNGLIEPIWGQDHYLRSVDVERLMRRMLSAILVGQAFQPV